MTNETTDKGLFSRIGGHYSSGGRYGHSTTSYLCTPCPPSGGYGYPSPAGYPPVGYPYAGLSHHSGYGSSHHMVAGGATAGYGMQHHAYGGHQVAHGHHGYGHHGKFKHSKFGFGNRWKHASFKAKFKKWK